LELIKQKAKRTMETNSLPTAETKPPKLRWFHPTPGRLLIALLAVEGVLLLSERFQWFAFNEKKGWTVLIAIASVGVAMVLMLFWFVFALCFRWRFQFSLRSLLILTVAVALPFSWLAVEMRWAKEQRQAIERIHELGGQVYYGNIGTGRWNGTPLSRSAGWCYLLGDEFFADAISVDLHSSQATDAELEHIEGMTELEYLWLNTQITDAGLEHLTGLTKLDYLVLQNTQITDAGLEHLTRLTNLQYLFLNGTQVTDDGVRKLDRALPHCHTQR